MFWNESQNDKPFQVPDEIIDLAFKINCQCLPLEHARQLSLAIHQALPWISEEEMVGIHLIYGAESGNGWQRPEDTSNEVLYLSRRTRMSLRLPKSRIEDAIKLTGQTLEIDEYSIVVGESSVKLLSTSSTIFSRYVSSSDDETEDAFQQRAYSELQGMGINVSKLLCGKTHILQGYNTDIFTRSLMLAELTPEESIKVQQLGIGEGRKMGCGLFLAHKGIAPVKGVEDD
ncbi:MAG: type I-MYXAN CRISPR-associated protein Cas6/Cmx6 [Gammaproteobacteria bacterium]|nr:type I-MYXAN CRISPR-associated protein Cas6/Cmx6 [Gammaproteobacteria bacterium]